VKSPPGFASEHWPFAENPETVVFTTRPILERREPILYVSHDADDGAWQFHSHEAPTEETASVVSLREVFELDRSVAALANLPMGWRAWRQTRPGPWDLEARRG
jgi:hypothetical protein